jgi:predicted 2-oxoglutarate/Fe(II)-dependent dioxygenase YbiX
LPITQAAQNNETIRKINNQCYEIVTSAVQSYRNIFKIHEEIKDAESYGLLRYSVGEKYDQHYDGGTESSRSISVLIYLNDDYEGGEIEFPFFNLKIKPKAGTLMLFPSNYAYSHIAHPVMSGTKYVIVTFLKDR